MAFKELTAEEQQHLMGLAAQRRKDKDKSMDGDLFAPELCQGSLTAAAVAAQCPRNADE